jgi:hypothetical protein
MGLRLTVVATVSAQPGNEKPAERFGTIQSLV